MFYMISSFCLKDDLESETASTVQAIRRRCVTSYKRFGRLKRQPDQHENFQLELHPPADEISHLDK